MADAFMMPKLGLTMEAGTIVEWLLAEGAEVSAGQAVLTIETDKVESEVEATASGRLHQTGQVGTEYACGATIGWLLGPGEEPPAAGPGARSEAADSSTPATVSGRARPEPAMANAAPRATSGIGGRLLASPNGRRVAAQRGIDLQTVAGTGPGGRITSEDVLAATPPSVAPSTRPDSPPTGGSSSGSLATAAARQLADLLGVDLGLVSPAGVDQRVSRDDVAAHVRAELAGSADRPLAPPLLQQPTSVIPFTGMRGAIAGRMSSSLASMAQLTLTMDVDMGGVVADRDRRRSEGNTVPGFTDYVIAAAAQALVEHPLVNSQVTDEGVALLSQVHVGLAVAVADGLIVPVVHNTLGFDLDALAAETTRLAEAARNRKLSLPELEGGTFSVTALGMFDVDSFTPIVNAPNTAILGVGRLRDGLAWDEDGAPARVPTLTLSLTWDHRAFDGAPAAEFTRSIKRRLEAHR